MYWFISSFSLDVWYTHFIKLIFSFLMVFILSQLDILRNIWYFKVLVYKKSKTFVQWPKYIAILYNFDKYNHKTVLI